MRVTLDGTDYFITWQYDLTTNCRSNFTPKTTCIITKRGFIEIAKASVGCYAYDTFSKDLGRKLSLAKVLAITNFGKSNNRTVWEKYLNTTRRDPKKTNKKLI